MHSILDEFHREMDLLKLYIDFQDKSYKNQLKLEGCDTSSKFKPLLPSKMRQFDFNTRVISIYGAYENFVEQLLAKYSQAHLKVL